MGRRTACDATQWRELTRTLLRRAAREIRVKYFKDGKIPIDTWRKIAGEILRYASQDAIQDCDVDRIVNDVLSHLDVILRKAGVA